MSATFDGKIRLCIVSTVLLPLMAAAAPGYTFTDLGAPQRGSSSRAFDINDQGVIVGDSSPGLFLSSRPTVWFADRKAYLDYPLSGGIGQAFAVNNRGQAAGWTRASESSPSTGNWWNGATRLSLGNGRAHAINDHGVIVGYSSAGPNSRAAISVQGSPVQLLPVLDGTTSMAEDINNQGQIIGIHTTADGTVTAVRWDQAGIRRLATPAGLRTTWARAINDSGQVVGYGSNDAGDVTLLWNGDTASVLGSLGGSHSQAYDINNAGLIVGYSTPPAGADKRRATLWIDGSAHDLNTLMDASPADWLLLEAHGINEQGWIVGIARYTGVQLPEYEPSGTTSRAFLLKPLSTTPAR